MSGAFRRTVGSRPATMHYMASSSSSSRSLVLLQIILWFGMVLVHVSFAGAVLCKPPSPTPALCRQPRLFENMRFLNVSFVRQIRPYSAYASPGPRRDRRFSVFMNLFLKTSLLFALTSAAGRFQRSPAFAGATVSQPWHLGALLLVNSHYPWRYCDALFPQTGFGATYVLKFSFENFAVPSADFSRDFLAYAFLRTFYLLFDHLEI